MDDCSLMTETFLSTLDGSRCLVTGGAGFIGSHLIDSLRSQGAFVRVLDNYSTGYAHNLDHVREDPMVDIVEGDASDASAVKKCVDGIDVIFHSPSHHLVNAALNVKIINVDIIGAECKSSMIIFIHKRDDGIKVFRHRTFSDMDIETFLQPIFCFLQRGALMIRCDARCAINVTFHER